MHCENGQDTVAWAVQAGRIQTRVLVLFSMSAPHVKPHGHLQLPRCLLTMYMLCFKRMIPVTSMLSPFRRRRPIPFGQERHVFSDTAILRGQPPKYRTDAELSRENHLQVTNQAPTGTKSGGLSGNKVRDAKPRLLLMGLRR